MIYDYKGTGKTAYVFKLENFVLPETNVDSWALDRVLAFFKPTTALSEGEHTVESILSWDNNSTAANGNDPNTVYSSAQVNASTG